MLPLFANKLAETRDAKINQNKILKIKSKIKGRNLKKKNNDVQLNTIKY